MGEIATERGRLKIFYTECFTQSKRVTLSAPLSPGSDLQNEDGFGRGNFSKENFKKLLQVIWVFPNFPLPFPELAGDG